MQPPPALSPPPDDMDFIDREIDRDSNHGGNDPGPHEAIQGNAQTLYHPILNGTSFICSFFIYFQASLIYYY